ncbi:moeb/ThiF domain-containing protein [Schizosaccharomyces japonicus yFS275]|uniref:Moeb/ThiF domain-containing protein n=1 Tax=Schizosaccharomyces japonicus (strain yFS275 / FY16936) TaxID=402676 RepID=B6JZP2_SCHJY|nr:moeb/ThiF domain-containing protein [Schizosaccharomyces japonicus yFS275]EEB07010.1 moeb/ThiF domain-containing protein [Schizosaccharomyces japonicus yFS275]
MAPKWFSSRTWVAISSSLATAAILLGTIQIRKQCSRRKYEKLLREESTVDVMLDETGFPIDKKERAAASQLLKEEDPEMKEQLIREQLARNYAFFGEKGMSQLRNALVVVVGCGGVGSWVTVMLARSGVGRIRIIDFDQISLSSLNRHSVATLKDVGTPKVVALKNAIASFAPWVDVDARITLFQKDNADELLMEGQPVFIVDAIDNIQTKVDLLAYCHEHNLRVISSTGSACKSDPTRINIADISATAEDPLSRATRRRLRLRGITEGIRVVYSSEKPDPEKASLLPLSEEEFSKGQVDELSVLPEFRVRILPVMGPLPGIFGLTIATHILTTLAEYPTAPISTQSRPRLYDESLKRIHAEARNDNVHLDYRFSAAEMSYLIEEVYAGRSALPPHETQKITLVRWDPAKPFAIENFVAMTRNEARHHEETVLANKLDPTAVYPAEVVETVHKFLKRIQCWKQLY